MNEFLYLILPSFVIGLSVCGIYHLVRSHHQNRIIRRLEGLLESDRLVKETLRKESVLAFNMKEQLEQDLSARLKEAKEQILRMDQDILLLQQSNEMNEAEFKAAQPELYDLKIRLIEAQNTISRLKKQIHLTAVAV